MADQTTGMGAEVGVKKRDEDGEVTDTAGEISGSHSRRGWIIFWILVALSMIGVWKLIELGLAAL